MTPTPFRELPAAELGAMLTRDLVVAGSGWTSRADLVRAATTWAWDEAADLKALGEELPRSFARLTGREVYAALRAVGVRETRWSGTWGFVARLRDDGGPAFADFLSTRVHDATGLTSVFTPQAELYNAYCATVPAGVKPMSMTQFVAAMAGEGYVHVRRWTTTEHPETGQRRRDKHVWGFREVSLARPAPAE